MRSLLSLGLLLVVVSVAGCGGVSEVTPDESKTPKVDPAEVQKQIQEGMKMGGSAYKKYPKGAGGN